MPDLSPQLRKAVAAWAVLSVLGVLGIVLLLGSHMPPGRGSREASEQTTANILIASIMLPIAIALWIFFGLALATFRQRGDTIEDGPPLVGNTRVQATWVAATTLIVLFLAIFGTFSLLDSAKGASGGGQGSDPLVTPGGKALQVQVIGQQWAWTFRYPDDGGFETTHLVLPVGRLVEFHVSSLDVVHSFWAYELGVKADAVPGSDNVAFVTANKLQTFSIRCAEVCGLWHGYMSTHGEVVGASAFSAWLQSEKAATELATHALPAYSREYYPDPPRRAG
jgi:cytochrome c oxidase subunit II